jgi:hypothetical protein
MARANGHPLQTGWNQPVAAHRLVLFAKIGPGTHPCHWCGTPVTWTMGERRTDALTTDHVDFDKAQQRAREPRAGVSAM